MIRKNDNRQVKKPKEIYLEFKGFEIEEKFQLKILPEKSFLKECKDEILRNSIFVQAPLLDRFEWIFNFD